MTGAAFAAALEAAGYDFFTGVPCSLVEDVIAALERRAYVAAVREDVALGLAAGAWLGGRTPVVLMQNSGLGTSLNALASLTLLYGLPCLLVVTWRGHDGRDAPEHILMGEISPRLLEMLGVPHRVLAAGSAAADLDWARREMDARSAPVALLVPPRVIETGGLFVAGTARPAWAEGGLRKNDGGSATPDQFRAVVPRISRLAALRAAVKQLGDEPVIHANGYICRESCSIADRPENFYMIGSMGLASAIGLGLALARPTGPTVVFDGDGNLLMSLGALAMVGGLAPANLVHVVFDNEVYGSTGNQRSPSRDVRLDALAGAAGYRTTVAADDEDGIRDALGRALQGRGPHFVLAKVTTEEADVPRITHAPTAIRDRFRAGIRVP